MQVYRSKEQPCSELIDRPDYDKVYGAEKCEIPFQYADFSDKEFDGAIYEQKKSLLDTQTTSYLVPNKGNFKNDIKIKEWIDEKVNCDEEGHILSKKTKLVWKDSLNALFQPHMKNGTVIPGWLEPPTQGMVMHFSIISRPNNCLVWFRLIMIKTPAGLYQLDY